MAPKIRIGDVIEIATKEGFAYAQYSHDHAGYGTLLRMLPGVFDERPADMCALTTNGERFFTFYPLAAAVQRGFVAVAANCALPAHARPFPLMRHRGWRNPETRTMRWWLWDANGVEIPPQLDTLTDDQLRRSVAEICNHEALVEKIETDWAPHTSPHPVDGVTPGPPPQPAATRATSVGKAKGEQRLRHYLYFRDRRTAGRAVAQLRTDGSAAQAQPSADGSTWLVLVAHDTGQDSDAMRNRLEKIATELHGEYDGWELEA